MNLRGAQVSHQFRGQSHGRLRAHRILTAFLVGFALLIGLSAAAGAAAGPSLHASCRPTQPCGSPPVLPQALVTGTLWRSGLYGYTLEYPGDLFAVAGHDGAGVILGAHLQDGSTATIIIHATPTGRSTPAHAVSTALSQLRGVTQVVTDTDPGDFLLGPGVGHRPGAGGIYVGVAAAPQGVSQSDRIASEAATNGRLTISATVVSASSDAGPQSELYRLADGVVNTIHWPGE